ncbi:M48 family metalloprotease [Streptomyces sp. NEAU-Y11]|uniref:M48 family metalloprotease n=1 Tax=Streptomyces cucumeris TaxID=2962890 RepID=UPI0020C9037C|nr:M48 family metallopeptidase [Streptomyces sp. NEAU-Y11]MCP9206957.1 M48 family metallopeptidase [Streptomyces sp. NEAU-Y11]
MRRTPSGGAVIAAARALLAVALLAGFYGLVVVLVLLWVGFLVLALWGSTQPTATTPPTNVILLCAAFAPAIAGMVWAVIRTARPAGPPAGTVWVSRRGAPELWAVVEELALAVGTRRPDHIRLTTEVNASVTEDASFLGLVPGSRTLYLGLPLLAGLPPAQLRAVLAHELGHFSRRHNRFGALAQRGTAGLEAARQAIRDASSANDLVRLYAGGPLGLVGLYARVFRRLTRPVRRRQELEADREAARVAGADAVADALRSTAVLERLWPEFIVEFLVPMRRARGCAPDDPFRIFAQMAEAPELRELMAEVLDEAVRRPADPDDPHPDLATRLRRLRALPAAPDMAAPHAEGPPAPAAAAAPAAPARYAAELGRSLCPGAAETIPWRDWLALLATQRATRILTPLADAVRTVEREETDGERTGPLTIHRVLRLVDSGRRMPLARALNARLDPVESAGREPLEPLAAALSVLIGAQLVAGGTAYWAMHWTGPGTLVPPDGLAPETIHSWAETAVQMPGQTQRLGLHLAALGVAERAPLPDRAEAKASPGAPRDEVRSVSITPGVPEPARRRIGAIRALALTVLLGVTGLAYLLWSGRDEPSYYRPPVNNWTQTPGGGVPGAVPTYGLPTGPDLPTGLPTALPTGPLLPTGVRPPITGRPLPSPPRPSIDIGSILPRQTP